MNYTVLVYFEHTTIHFTIDEAGREKTNRILSEMAEAAENSRVMWYNADGETYHLHFHNKNMLGYYICPKAPSEVEKYASRMEDMFNPREPWQE